MFLCHLLAMAWPVLFFLFSTALLREHVCRLYEISYYKMSQIVMLGLKLRQEPLPNQLIVPH